MTSSLGDDTPASEVERHLRSVAPGARLVPARIVRRVAFRLSEDAPTPIHDDLPVRVTAAWLDGAAVPGVRLDPGDPDELLFLPRPADRWDDLPALPIVLRDYWALLLFDAAASAVRRAVPDDSSAAKRLAGFGPRAECELVAVLLQDYRLPAEAGAAARLALLAGAAAVFETFRPDDWGGWLPSFPPAGETWGRLGAGADLADLARRTRPPLAIDAIDVAATAGEVEAEDDSADDGAEEHVPRLEKRARKSLRRGNAVRAAIIRWRIARRAAPATQARAEASARSTLHDGLAVRLGAVLGWGYDESRRWGRLLGGLLPYTRSGHWSRAARALYDLQTIAGDLAGELSVTDPIEYARTLGRRPLRRRIDHARPVLALRHLRSAAYHLDRVPAPAAVREPLHKLLVREVHRSEARIRVTFGPLIGAALTEAGLRPGNRLEEVAHGKVVAELLDRLCERGQLRFADARDAIARSDLKLGDLAGPGEFFGGDALLRLDALLAERLDGVYRRGEVYLRWIQRANALAFGTGWGRWVTLYLAGPFGGAFMLVVFAKYLAHEFEKVSEFAARQFPDEAFVGPPAPPLEQPHGVELGPQSTAAILAIGFFLLALLHVPRFREAVFRAAVGVGTAVRWLVWDGPAALWRSPWLKALRRHPAVAWLRDRLGTALMLAAAAFALVVAVRLAAYGTAAVTAFGLVAETAARAAGWVFVASAVGLNTPPGRVVNDWLAERIGAAWQYVRVHLLPGLFAGLWTAFRRMAEAVERGLYSVDEWLRFRRGVLGNALAVRVVLAALWFPVAYLVRFAFYLLLEPQINPIKHFPVVTVSHKLLLPLIPSLADATGLSKETAFLIIACIPGVFGFMAWELQENWRLYRANRPSKPRPARLGHHGETARALLRPGFHSGTVPKLFAKLRAATREHGKAGLSAKESRYRHELEELASAVQLGVERGLLHLLDRVPAWRAEPAVACSVAFGVESIVVTLARVTGEPYRLAVMHCDGRIVARIESLGWVADLPPAAAEAFGVGVERLATLLAAEWAGDRPRPAGGPSMAWGEQVPFWDRATGYGAKGGA